MVLLITGNNVTLNPDLMERTLWVELFCEDADPQARIDPAFILDDVWLSNIDNRRRIPKGKETRMVPHTERRVGEDAPARVERQRQAGHH